MESNNEDAFHSNNSIEEKKASVMDAFTKSKFVGNYELLKTIGEGSFAKVKLATHRLTNQSVPIP